jgi:hypothetical protein
LRFLGVLAGLVIGSPAQIPVVCGFGLLVIQETRIPSTIILIITTTEIQVARITADLTEVGIMAVAEIAVVAEDIIDLVMSRLSNQSPEPTLVGAFHAGWQSAKTRRWLSFFR